MQEGDAAEYLEDDLEIVEVQYRGKTYYIKEMTGTERDRFEIASFKQNGAGTQRVDMLHLRARLVSFCEVHKDGSRIRGTSEAQIAVYSDRVPSGKLAVLFAAAQKLNGLEATAVEDAEKNSASDPENSSTSGSLSDLEKPSLNS